MTGRQNFLVEFNFVQTPFAIGVTAGPRTGGTCTLPRLLLLPMAGPLAQQGSLHGVCEQRALGAHCGRALDSHTGPDPLSLVSPLLSEIKSWNHQQSRSEGVGRPAPGRAEPPEQALRWLSACGKMERISSRLGPTAGVDLGLDPTTQDPA